MVRGTQKFAELYRRLNPTQKQAVDSIEGPVMVIAGPGTGKTLVLTLRIANILKKTDVEPENILALTFTEAGASEMRRRLADIIGSPAYRVEINTFHGFCNGVIQRYPESFPNIIGSTHISEIEQIGILKEIIGELPLTALRPFGSPFHYLHDIRRAIDDLKKDDIRPEEFKKIIAAARKKVGNTRQTPAQKRRVRTEQQKQAELCRIYSRYEAILRKRQLYDFSDMVIEVVRALTDDRMLRLSLQEQYLYILADEHQDANMAQNKVLELLSSYHSSPNLFLVGDEKQAIFRFQGASLENFRYFLKKFKKVQRITLTRNYRSHQFILDAAQSLISQNSEPTMGADAVLAAAPQTKNGHITLAEFSRPDAELFFIANEIAKKIKNGDAPNEIAVLTRDNRDSLPLISFLERAGVPYVLESDQNILDDPDISQLVTLLRGISRYGDDEALVPVLHTALVLREWKIDPLAVYRLIAERSARASMHEQMRTRQAFRKFARALASWHTLSHNRPLVEVFEIIVRESGFIAFILAHERSLEKLEKLDALFSEAKALAERNRSAKLADFIGYLDLLAEHNMLIKRPVGGHRQNHVHVLTAHRAKGREFDSVYITNAFYGHWGNRRTRSGIVLPTAMPQSQAQTDDDERKLFYVALTRARKGITVTYSRTNADGRARLVSRFVAEIDPRLVRPVDTAGHEHDFTKTREALFAPALVREPELKSKAFVRELFRKRGFSVTHLNSYLSCPWRYFYVNLVRVPQAKTRHEMYGSAVHSALKRFFSAMAANTDAPSKEALVGLFNDALAREPLAGHELELAREKGERALRGYYDAYAAMWHPRVITEFAIRGIPFADGVVLTGILDKVEIISDRGDVHVVDYKTGRPQTRAAILGKNKNSDGNYLRQLVFYKLLLDRYASGKYRMASGEIDFVEPDRSGRYRKEIFTVSDDDVRNLGERILSVAKEIRTLAFWNARCGNPQCFFCSLREEM